MQSDWSRWLNVTIEVNKPREPCHCEIIGRHRLLTYLDVNGIGAPDWLIAHS